MPRPAEAGWGDARRVRRFVLATVARRWRLAIVIWRNRRSEPEREHEIISQYGQHAVLHALGSKRAAKEFLDGLDVADTER